jgi:hypothetical protein
VADAAAGEVIIVFRQSSLAFGLRVEITVLAGNSIQASVEIRGYSGDNNTLFATTAGFEFRYTDCNICSAFYLFIYSPTILTRNNASM